MYTVKIDEGATKTVEDVSPVRLGDPIVFKYHDDIFNEDVIVESEPVISIQDSFDGDVQYIATVTNNYEIYKY